MLFEHGETMFFKRLPNKVKVVYRYSNVVMQNATQTVWNAYDLL